MAAVVSRSDSLQGLASLARLRFLLPNHLCARESDCTLTPVRAESCVAAGLLGVPRTRGELWEPPAACLSSESWCGGGCWGSAQHEWASWRMQGAGEL